MTNKSQKNEQHWSSLSKETATSTKRENLSGANTDFISTEQMKAILERAHQTVKPLIEREKRNEIVSEKILNLKLKRTETR